MSKTNDPGWFNGRADLDGLADPWHHIDYYGVNNLDDHMCEHNRLMGNCGASCICYLRGDCPIEDEVNEALWETDG